MKLVDRIWFIVDDTHRFLYRNLWKLFHFKLYKNPELYIPKNTMYCYNWNGENGTRERMIDGKKVMLPYWGVDECIFHKYGIDHIDLCMYTGTDCCMDSCKDCGINEEELPTQ
jgi:hypothetical protein